MRGFPGGSADKESVCNAGDPGLIPGLGRSPGERDRLSTPVFMGFLGFPGGSDNKKSACNVGDLGSIPVLGRSPGEGNGYPLQCSGLENYMDRGAWWATVHGAAELDTTGRLSTAQHSTDSFETSGLSHPGPMRACSWPVLSCTREPPGSSPSVPEGA